MRQTVYLSRRRRQPARRLTCVTVPQISKQVSVCRYSHVGGVTSCSNVHHFRASVESTRRCLATIAECRSRPMFTDYLSLSLRFDSAPARPDQPAGRNRPPARAARDRAEWHGPPTASWRSAPSRSTPRADQSSSQLNILPKASRATTHDRDRRRTAGPSRAGRFRSPAVAVARRRRWFRPMGAIVGLPAGSSQASSSMPGSCSHRSHPILPCVDEIGSR